MIPTEIVIVIGAVTIPFLLTFLGALFAALFMCKHDWKRTGTWGGHPQFKCSKCGTQQTQSTPQSREPHRDW